MGDNYFDGCACRRPPAEWLGDAGGKLMLMEFIALLNDPDAFIATLYGGELWVEPRRELATQTFASPADIQAASHASGA
jgi:hypothetical protein